jgi:hypothetical protein
MPISVPANASPSSPGAGNIVDIQQLQRWTQHADVTFTELNNAVNRLNNMIDQLIKLNHLVHP